MNAAVRRALTSVPALKVVYVKARAVYNGRRTVQAAEAVFANPADYQRALTEKVPGQRIDLVMKDGLRFTVRQNGMDAAVLSEVFIDKEYASGFKLPDRPTIIDIGGYIGDFAIYSAKYLNARKVVTVEPSAQNFALVEANIRNNNFGDRIAAINKAVTDGSPIMLNIDTAEDAQVRVTAYGDGSGELKEVPGISLAQIMADHGISTIDLLKMDCEGGEYTILSTVPSAVLQATRNIIFEYHEIPGFAPLLANVKSRLGAEGFVVKTCGRGNNLISATR